LKPNKIPQASLTAQERLNQIRNRAMAEGEEEVQLTQKEMKRLLKKKQKEERREQIQAMIEAKEKLKEEREKLNEETRKVKLAERINDTKKKEAQILEILTPEEKEQRRICSLINEKKELIKKLSLQPSKDIENEIFEQCLKMKLINIHEIGSKFNLPANVKFNRLFYLLSQSIQK